MISALPNKDYNPTPTAKVHEKYTPLASRDYDKIKKKLITEGIIINGDDEVNTIIANRKLFFSNLGDVKINSDGSLECFLNFYGKNITKISNNEKAKASDAGSCVPPLLVISSNRSKYLAKQFLQIKNETPNQGISKKEYLPNQPNGKDSVNLERFIALPIYMPNRLKLVNSKPRSVFIFVRKDEYDTYYNNLKQFTNVTIIGWNSTIDSKKLGMFGFGMSRFAAVEFAKYIFNDAGQGNTFDKAWLIDDNVSYLTGGRNLDYFEERLSTSIALGFKGCNNPVRGVKITDDETKEVAWKGTQPQYLIQQMMLLNISKLTTRQKTYDFSPLFILSGEDYSFTQITYQFELKSYIDEDFRICKGQVYDNERDETSSYKLINSAKFKLINDILFPTEKLTAIHPKAGDTSSKTLETVVNTMNKKDDESVEKTCTKAIEQILRTGMYYVGSGDYNWPAVGVYSQMFEIKTLDNTKLQDI